MFNSLECKDFAKIDTIIIKYYSTGFSLSITTTTKYFSWPGMLFSNQEGPAFNKELLDFTKNFLVLPRIKS